MHESQFSNTKFKNFDYIASYTLFIGFFNLINFLKLFYILFNQKYV
jgi:hypothetical protein